MLAALRLLDEGGILTAEGGEELHDALGADTALLDDHVKRAAQAFLDQHYDEYLEATRYGEPPPVDLL